MAERPNILLIHSDQHRFDCVGANGHPLLKTPALDRLATAGVNFRRAYTPVPVCMPARNSLMFGQWPTRHGVIANTGTEASPVERPSSPTFSQCLRDAGYSLGYVGKWQVHPIKTPLDYGFEDYIDYGEYGTWRRGQGLPPPRKWDEGWGGQTDEGVSPEQSCLGWGAERTMELIERYAHLDRPFFVRWDSREPHLPNVVPEPFASMYRPESLSPWPGFGDDFTGKPYVQAQQLRTWGVAGWSWEQWAPIVARYLGEVSLLDAQVGRLLTCLDNLGLCSNTLVVYTTDHGDMCGSHGMVDKHYVMYDDVVRVPLIMRWPEHIRPGTVCDEFVSHGLDLAATFCEVAGAAVPAAFQGQSLAALMAGGQGNGRRDIFSMYHGNQMGLYTQRMVRDRCWKYVWNATAEDELYDLTSDPGELTNRATDGDCAETLARLRGRMVAWMEEVEDPILNWWTRRQLAEGRTV